MSAPYSLFNVSGCRQFLRLPDRMLDGIFF